MAEFLPAFERMIANEGGFKLHTVEGDRGGATYAGIARKMNPSWFGWTFIDQGQEPPAELVRSFYREGYWVPLRADEITAQHTAQTLFDFAVNTSAPGRPSVAAKLAQMVAGVTPDGSVGPKTLAAINAMDPALFCAQFALAKLARYRDIVTKDRTQQKFLLGWLNRTLREAAP